MLEAVISHLENHSKQLKLISNMSSEKLVQDQLSSVFVDMDELILGVKIELEKETGKCLKHVD